MKKELYYLEVAFLLLTGTKESDILLRYDLLPYLNKAREIVKIIKR